MEFLFKRNAEEEREWRRIERPIQSSWWQAMHNMVAHPLLTIYRPWGERFHAYTAARMYEGEEFTVDEDGPVNG